MSAVVRTTCPYCGVGCGVLATPTNRGVELRGDPQHPANRGRLCSKGSALGETLGLEGRLLRPSIHGRQVDWDDALDAVATGFRECIDTYGPESVALYVSGQLLTEDYYVANKLVKGWLGTANIDTNSRLCMASAVAGYKRAFGEDVDPVGYDDLELADLIVLVGSNTAWCHPVILQRILAARERRPHMRIVVIDPRVTATAELADLHLPIKAGTDVRLFNGLLAWLADRGCLEDDYVVAHTQGASEALATARRTSGSAAAVAAACALDVQAVETFFEWFAATPAVITAFSQGVNQSSAGTDKVNAIINCHLATGRIGRPGAGPFSITGQPNAMGGREVGGFANTLAAHVDLDDETGRAAVQEFWGSPRIAAQQGPKAVEMFDAIHDGRIRAVWIIATNPVVSLPDADKVRTALAMCEFVVVSDCVASTDTTALAHVLLPALAWGEKDGTVTNSERTISRQRAFLPPPGAAKPDWWIICEVAKRLGFAEGFEFAAAHEVFREHVRLTAHANDGRRALDLGAWADITIGEYAAWQPAAWPMSASRESAAGAIFGDGRFMHGDRKARFVALAPRPPEHAICEDYPLVLNTGRVRDHWHTMTRTGKSARLSAHAAEPYVEIHPGDALLFGVRAGELARLRSRWGSMVVRVQPGASVPRGMVFAPIHWSRSFASDARVGALTNPVVDPLSGEPELKHTPVAIEPFSTTWFGVVLTRQELRGSPATWWTRVTGPHFTRYEIAGAAASGIDWSSEARRLLGAQRDDADFIEFRDPAFCLYRAAYIVDDRLEGCFYVSHLPALPDRDWLASLFTVGKLDQSARNNLLAGRSHAVADQGRIVCSCFGVGRNPIAACARELGAIASSGEIGRRLKAGTNCGSCVAEIGVVIREVAQAAAMSGGGTAL